MLSSSDTKYNRNTATSVARCLEHAPLGDGRIVGYNAAQL